MLFETCRIAPSLAWGEPKAVARARKKKGRTTNMLIPYKKRANMLIRGPLKVGFKDICWMIHHRTRTDEHSRRIVID